MIFSGGAGFHISGDKDGIVLKHAGSNLASHSQCVYIYTNDVITDKLIKGTLTSTTVM